MLPVITTAAHAQASLDPRALEPLQKPAATPPPVAVPPTPPPARVSRPAPPAAPTPATQIRVPLAPPPVPVIPPPLVVPTRPLPPPPPPPVAADAPGAAGAIPGGLRVTFGEGRSDLNPGTEAALRALARSAAADVSFSVNAFSRGSPEDPSTPRRLALSRALAVRSVLIAEGIPSLRIYVKALGAGHGVEDGPADRADVTTAAANPQTKSPP